MIKYGDFAQGIRCLLMQRLRSFLSTLGVLFGVVSVIAMLAIGEGSKQEILTQIEQLGTNNIIIRQSELSEDQQKKALEGRSQGLTLEDAQILKKNISLIQKQTVLKIVKGHIGGVPPEVSPEILAVNPVFSEIKGLKLSEGRFLGDLDISQRHQVCVLGAEIAQKLGKWGHVGQNIRIDNLQFHVIGVLSNKNWVEGKTKVLNTRNLNKSIFIPIGIEKGFPRQSFFVNNTLSEIILQLDNRAQMGTSAEAIKRMMEVMHKGVEDYQIIIPHELLAQANQTQKIFNLVLGGIAAISMFVGGIGIMNIMLATISDRTREIGIRRAVGASQYHIAKQFLIETLILTLSGACLGLLGGIIFSYLIGSFAGWNVIVTGWSIFLALGMAIIVGIISGLYPAIKAASMDPIVALRYL
jgi:putative ABC transport system permease protein